MLAFAGVCRTTLDKSGMQSANMLLQEVARTCSLRLGLSETRPLSHSRADEIEDVTADVPTCSVLLSTCGNSLKADECTCKRPPSSQAVSRLSGRHLVNPMQMPSRQSAKTAGQDLAEGLEDVCTNGCGCQRHHQ